MKAPLHDLVYLYVEMESKMESQRWRPDCGQSASQWRTGSQGSEVRGQGPIKDLRSETVGVTAEHSMKLK